MKERSATLPRRYPRVVLVGGILLLTLLAWSNRFIQDDAFISFRYAEHLAEGKGPVYNEGERVEGYTNFLWTVLIAAGRRLGFEPIAFSYGLGMACFAGSLVFTYRLSCRVFGDGTAGLLAVFLLGTNYTFSAYATGGLETQLQAFLCVAVASLVFQIVAMPVASRTALVALSLLIAAALLTRLDSSVYLFVLLPAVFFHLLRQADVSIAEKGRQMACLCLSPLLTVGGWLLWKLSYYGDILPNTFYAKVGSVNTVPKGLFYCAEFVQEYWLVPFLFLGIAAVGKILRERNRPLQILLLTVVLWCIYVVRVGGDFMEFRFLVPVMPLMFVAITWLLLRMLQPAGVGVGVALAAMLVVGSWNHARSYDNRGIESIRQLQRHITGPRENWQAVGRKLGELFGDAESNVVIATTAAGAIPYYSRLETIDMGGLNDRWVARHGAIVGARAGHQRIATFDYLLKRGVNLVVGVPLVMPRNAEIEPLDWVQRAEEAFQREAIAAKLSPDCRMIEIPLNPDYKITILYLTPNDHVDKIIHKHKLKTHPLSIP